MVWGTGSLPAQHEAMNIKTVILGNGVNVREKPEPTAKVVGKLNFWDRVTITQKTKTYSDLVEGQWHSGEGYPWFWVKAANGVSGWVFGQYVGTEPEEVEIGEGASKFRFGEEYFSMYATASRWYSPVEDGNGPYFEEMNWYYYFQKPNTKEIYPLMAKGGNEPLLKPSGSGWGGCYLAEAWYPDRAEGYDLMLFFDCNYQESSEKFFYYLSQKDNQIVVTKEWGTGALYPAGN